MCTITPLENLVISIKTDYDPLFLTVNTSDEFIDHQTDSRAKLISKQPLYGDALHRFP